jgi:hypothetical protein
MSAGLNSKRLSQDWKNRYPTFLLCRHQMLLCRHHMRLCRHSWIVILLHIRGLENLAYSIYFFTHTNIKYVRFWLATFWLTKSLVCIHAFIRDSTILSDVRRFSTAYKLEDLCSLSAVWTTCHPIRTLICPLFHPSGRCDIQSGHPDRPSIICPDDVLSHPDLHCFEKLLFQLESVRTFQQPVRTHLSDRSASDSFEVQFEGRFLQPSGRRGFPSGHAHT